MIEGVGIESGTSMQALYDPNIGKSTGGATGWGKSKSSRILAFLDRGQAGFPNPLCPDFDSSRIETVMSVSD